MNIIPDQLNGRFPYNIRFINSEPVIDWLFAGKCRFTDPLFEDTIRKCRSMPENNKERFSTTFEIIPELRKQNTSYPPSGFIFHTSRCGSTLISQMLAALPQNIVISEAPPVDTILRAKLNSKISDEQRTKWLEDLIWMLGQKRFNEEKSFFIKFDSWHILDFNSISSAFPGVPCIFLYRNPIEVLSSHRNIRGSFMVPELIEPEWFGLDSEWIKSISLDEYGAAVLCKIYEAGLNVISNGNALAINYHPLPGFIWTNLKDFFQLECSKEDLNMMKEISKYYSKNPTIKFTDIPMPEKRTASKHLEQLAEKYITPVYNKLEFVRNSY